MIDKKDKLRKKIMKIRNDLPKSDLLRKSNQIKKRLFALNEFKKASTILFYVSYDNEVFTHDMIKKCISNRKCVVVPVTDKENRRLIPSMLDNWRDLSLGAYGILEPKKEKIKEVSINKINLIVVPGVVFDERGHRIGHGAGYYDRLLRHSKNALRVGLAFEEQIVDKIPSEPHDIPVDKIVTEKRVIDCFKLF